MLFTFKGIAFSYAHVKAALFTQSIILYIFFFLFHVQCWKERKSYWFWDDVRVRIFVFRLLVSLSEC